jgi:hypothetical protein
VRREQQRLLDRLHRQWQGDSSEPFYRLFDEVIGQLDPSRAATPEQAPPSVEPTADQPAAEPTASIG